MTRLDWPYRLGTLSLPGFSAAPRRRLVDGCKLLVRRGIWQHRGICAPTLEDRELHEVELLEELSRVRACEVGRCYAIGGEDVIDPGEQRLLARTKGMGEKPVEVEAVSWCDRGHVWVPLVCPSADAPRVFSSLGYYGCEFRAAHWAVAAHAVKHHAFRNIKNLGIIRGTLVVPD